MAEPTDQQKREIRALFQIHCNDIYDCLVDYFDETQANGFIAHMAEHRKTHLAAQDADRTAALATENATLDALKTI